MFKENYLDDLMLKPKNALSMPARAWRAGFFAMQMNSFVQA